MWKGARCPLTHAPNQLRYLLSPPGLVGKQTGEQQVSDGEQGDVQFHQRAWFFKV